MCWWQPQQFIPLCFTNISVYPAGHSVKKEPSLRKRGWRSSLGRGRVCMCTRVCTHKCVCPGGGEVGWENHSVGGPSSDAGRGWGRVGGSSRNPRL